MSANGIPQDGPERLRYAVSVMNAAADGAEIEFTKKEHDEFRTITDPNWNWQLWDYRIASKPPRVCVACYYKQNSNGDPWTIAAIRGSLPRILDPELHEEIVPLIELTPEVRAALAAAGIDYEGRDDV